MGRSSWEVSTRASQRSRCGESSARCFRERKLNLLPDTIGKDQRLAGLEVTQLVVEDGWIATAIGPVRTAARANDTAK